MKHRDTRTLSPAALHAALTLRDLTDPGEGAHAMQLLIDHLVAALCEAWGCRVIVARSSPLTTVADNYDRLHYPPAGVARDARYTRYLSPSKLLRTHTSAMIPPLLRSLAASRIDDVLLVCPGLVYRRDCIDRLHTGEPHQLDLWRLRAKAPPLDRCDLESMIEHVVAATLPGSHHRLAAAMHPYTLDGLQIDVRAGDEWVEIGECGLASPAVLREAGLGAEVSGLAMGVGLDRLLMLRKQLDDIRLLRARDPRVATQMLDLAPYRPVSRQPPIRRDMSIAINAGAIAEDLGDRVRDALADDAGSVEEVAVLSETAYDELPPQAIERLGMRPHHKNVLLRVVLRDLERTLTHPEANCLRDRIYAALHEGDVYAWASRTRQAQEA